MGLAERRAQQEFETKHFPKLRKDIQSAAGFAVTVDVQWDTLQDDNASAQYAADNWTKVYFTPLIDALKAVGSDDLGKKALKGGLKKIVIRNTTKTYTGSSIANFDKGQLVLDHEPNSNVDDVGDRAKAIQSTLERAL